ncbi:MAG: hypothetical protein NWP99_02245 [Crocinitomicaceae bacterium]|nr:hypothetical protein [Crocinitomicaceae bacterium]
MKSTLTWLRKANELKQEKNRKRSPMTHAQVYEIVLNLFNNESYKIKHFFSGCRVALCGLFSVRSSTMRLLRASTKSQSPFKGHLVFKRYAPRLPFIETSARKKAGRM